MRILIFQLITLNYPTKAGGPKKNSVGNRKISNPLQHPAVGCVLDEDTLLQKPRYDRRKTYHTSRSFLCLGTGPLIFAKYMWHFPQQNLKVCAGNKLDRFEYVCQTPT